MRFHHAINKQKGFFSCDSAFLLSVITALLNDFDQVTFLKQEKAEEGSHSTDSLANVTIIHCAPLFQCVSLKSWFLCPWKITVAQRKTTRQQKAKQQPQKLQSCTQPRAYFHRLPYLCVAELKARSGDLRLQDWSPSVCSSRWIYSRPKVTICHVTFTSISLGYSLVSVSIEIDMSCRLIYLCTFFRKKL